MTDSSGGHTPLSRMRFSWQRRDELTDEELATPPDAPPPPEWEPEDAPGEAEQTWPAAGSGQSAPPPPPPPPPADRSGPAAYAGDPMLAPRPPSPEAKTAGYAPAPPPGPSDGAGRGAPTESPRARDTEKRPKRLRRSDGDFEVPRAGGRFSGRRGMHAGVRAALVLTCCLVVLGVVGFGAYVYGAAVAGDATYSLSEEDVANYHLDDFPVEQAGGFAAGYVRVCLDHPEGEAAQEQRQDQLAQYTTQGVDATCGWNGTGTQSVIDVSWSGDSEPMASDQYGENARWFTVQALTTSGRRVVDVPVYVQNLTRGEGMRVVGDVGEMPQPVLADVERPSGDTEVDQDLADALVDGEFFTQYFAAWGESDGATLQRFVDPDATPTARSGLNGALVQPAVSEAQVFFPDGAADDLDEDEFSWQVGDDAEAWVWVTWQNPRVADGTTTTRAYRVQLIKTADASTPTEEWAVRDIQGGVPDVDD